MAATKADLRAWFQHGLRMEPKPTRMVIVCDTFDWEDYPVYVVNHELVRLTLSEPGDMKKVMEVYDLTMDMESQMAEHRAWHL